MHITVSRNGQTFGPYTIEQTNALLASGQIRSGDLARYANDPNWVPLHTIPGVLRVPSFPGAPTGDESDKKILPAFLLAFLIGPLGIHRFYVGKTGSGIAMLITTFTVVGILVTAIWSMVDWIMILCGSFTDSNGKKLTQWT